MVHHIREKFGLTIHQGVLEDLELPTHSFDAIIMNHVLEHVSDPRITLETAGFHPLSINAPARQWGKKRFIDGITNALYGKTLWGGHLVAYAGVDRLDTDAETLIL